MDTDPSLIANHQEGEIKTVFRRHPRARHYRLRIEADGTAVVTIPRGGSQAEAARFFEKHREWAVSERNKRRAEAHGRIWRPGTNVLYRGTWEPLVLDHSFGRPLVRLADQQIPVADPEMDFRRPVCAHFRSLAKREFPGRVAAIAEIMKVTHTRTSVRDQSTRWGSCSHAGTISLNWRLIQAPPSVADYVIIHELTHRAEMNHSSRFWQRVERVCPRYREHEAWLNANGRELGL